MMKNFTIIIPVRYASERLPGKPLLDIAGKSMVQRVYEQALQVGAKKVIIATDDARIQHAAEQFSAPVVMTSTDHVSGTDRLEEVVSQLQLADHEIVVNVQGDEPLIPPDFIQQVAEQLKNSTADMATLSMPIMQLEDIFNPNIVKLVTNHQGLALYFSRAPIPWDRENFPQALNHSGWQRHIGIYAYRVGLLHEFVSWPAAPMEKIERLEQLRALYYGKQIQVAQVAYAPDPGVDTLEDLERVRARVSRK